MDDLLCRASVYCSFASNQVFTGAAPFSDKKNAAAMFDIMSGVRPPRPTHPTFTAELWILMQTCWDQNPYLRPEASEVLQVFLGP